MNGNTKLFESARVEKLAALFLLVAAFFVAFKAVDAFQALFDPNPVYGNVITVEGQGKVTAIPDTAQVNFTVSEEATTVALAQDAATKKTNTALALVRDLGIEDTDIKTTSYNVYPKYNRPQPCYDSFCPEYEQRIVGYTVSQTIEVKVRDTANAGAVLSALGGAGVSNLNGPSFTVDDPEALRAEARAEAIADAKQKAETLAKDLGVRLSRVTGYWENGGGYPIPYAAKEAYGLGGDASGASVPELPVGENEIAVSVLVTYEIR